MGVLRDGNPTLNFLEVNKKYVDIKIKKAMAQKEKIYSKVRD